jgi:hypothetical protein
MANPTATVLAIRSSPNQDVSPRGPETQGAVRVGQLHGLTTTRPIGSTGRAKCLIRSAVKIQGEYRRVLQSFHDFGRKPANSPSKTHGWQIPILERWLLIHDRETEAAAAALHTDCFSAPRVISDGLAAACAAMPGRPGPNPIPAGPRFGPDAGEISWL